MAALAGSLNVLMGAVYVLIGAITLGEMIRARRTLGFSHFGAAIVALAFTCGPHHFVHGMHIGFEGRTPLTLDLIAVLVGFPAGLAWAALRIEAVRGGQGDRFVRGTPGWLSVVPTVMAVYVTAVSWAMLAGPGVSLGELGLAAPNLLLVGLYAAIATFLIRTQLANRRALGGWSGSGLALAGLFATCTLMHAVYAEAALTALVAPDSHGLVVDWIAVPAAAYFLWVVHALYRGSFRDWNGAPAYGAEIPDAVAVGAAPR